MTIADNLTIARADPTPSGFPVNIRVTVPFIPRPIFLAVVAGTEKRSPTRLRYERERHPIATWGNFAFFFVTSTICLTAILFASLVANSL